MEYVLLSLVCATSYLIILIKMIGIGNVVRFQLYLDIIFTLGSPLLFLGTYSGMMTAFISGVIFSTLTFIMGQYIKPEPLLQFPYGKKNTSKSHSYGARPPRS